MRNRLMALMVVLLAGVCATASAATFSLAASPITWNLTGMEIVGTTTVDMTNDTLLRLGSYGPAPALPASIDLTPGTPGTALGVNLGSVTNLEDNLSNGGGGNSSNIDNLGMTVALTLGGQAYTFIMGVSASNTTDDVTFTAPATVTHWITQGYFDYQVSGTIQWSDNGSTSWGTSQTSANPYYADDPGGGYNPYWHLDQDTYRISFQIIDYVDNTPVGPVPEPATTALVGAGLALVGLVARRRMNK